MSLDYLNVYESTNKKVRIGSKNDGGYVIADNLNYDCIISCGIDTDINFEIEFCKKHPDIPCYAHDGTISNIPSIGNSSQIFFVKKNIMDYNSICTTNLFDLFEKYNNIFLKMDIETFEYRWFKCLSVDQLNKIKQMVVEFHFPFTEPGFTHLDTPLPIQTKTGILKTITNTHTLIHLHGNNCCGTVTYEAFTVPNVFECTYVRKDIQLPLIHSTDPIPTQLDSPNVNGPDIHLCGYPFIHRNK